jgi:hypothetical protein
VYVRARWCILGQMAELTAHRALLRGPWRPARHALPSRDPDTAVGDRARRILQLQREAGNHAVVRMLQRDTGSHRENPPVTDLHPPGTMDDAAWTSAFRAAVAAGTADAFRPLFRDIAVTAGLHTLPGFNLKSIPTSDGKTAQPGLNISMSSSDEPGHTGWVDKSGAFGTPLDFAKGAPDVTIAVILSPKALHAEKGLSLSSIRHEMVHVRHKLKVLDALHTWQASGRKSGFEAWLKGHAKKSKMSALDVALVSKGARDAAANTEVLAYVEGFTNDFHRRRPTADEAAMSFFELLGVVETRRLYTWAQADPAVQQEALTRLREYHATLDPDHQRLWKDWLDKQLAAAAKDTTGRKDFLIRLSAFVR